MTIHMTQDKMIADELARRQAEGRPVAIATVVRTVSSTAAKPGDKALLDENGTLITGFLGGGCVRGAVRRATLEAIAKGAPQLVSLKPQELLEAEGIAAGEARDGVTYARNGCPSRGSLDIFVEPVLPRQRLVICGGSAVAIALAELAEKFDLRRTICLGAAAETALPAVDQVADSFDDPTVWEGNPFVVVATQGQGDAAALMQALSVPTRFVAFVGSRRKFAALREKLIGEGVAAADLDRVHAPAGLHIHAITPEEIALSVLAQITSFRRNALV